MPALYELIDEGLFNASEAGLIEQALLELSADARISAMSPDVALAREAYMEARGCRSAPVIERDCALLELYLCLHRLGTRYEEHEAQQLRAQSGCANQPSGLWPLMVASRLMTERACFADLGCGNGLQGLLLQRLQPHRLTIQVELASSLVQTGKLMQQVFGIAEARVQWHCCDIAHAPVQEANLYYIYRPSKPHGQGHALYQGILQKLCCKESGAVVLSVANCMPAPEGARELYRDDTVTLLHLG